MTTVGDFIAVLARATGDLADGVHGTGSDYWDTIRAILNDKHFITMVTREMHDGRTRWPDAIRAMLAKCDRKILAMPREGRHDDLIEITGACKLLLDKYADEGHRFRT